MYIGKHAIHNLDGLTPPDHAPFSAVWRVHESWVELVEDVL